MAFGQLAQRVEVASQGAAADRQHRLVDRRAGHQAADRREFGFGKAAGLEHPVRRHHRVEARDRQVLRPQQQVAGHRYRGRGHAGGGPQQRPRQAQRRAGRMHQPAADQAQATQRARRRIGKPGLGRRRRRRRGAGVVEQRGQVGQPVQVDRGEVGLQQQRKAAAGQVEEAVQAFDDIGLPERAVQIQRASVDPRDLDAELPPVARLGQGDVANVVLQVELLVVHPVRVVQPQRHPLQPLAEQAQP